MRFYEEDDELPPPTPNNETFLPGRRNIGIEHGIKNPPKPMPTEEPKKGAEGRYAQRVGLFESDQRPLPHVRHHALWLLHNCIAHPALAMHVGPTTVEFHELTSQWLNHRDTQPVGMHGTHRFRPITYEQPKIGNQALWFLHNVLAHVAIGLLPCETTFSFHDWTAELMNVPGWV